MDDFLRWVLLGGLAGWGVVSFLGGLFTPVGGRWSDGQRRIDLKQFGPFVRGECRREGGREIYTGTAQFGRVRLARRDEGKQHLMALGFAEEVTPLIEGELMGRLDLKLRGRQLMGTFEGRRIASGRNPARILSVHRVKKTARIWTRA